MNTEKIDNLESSFGLFKEEQEKRWNSLFQGNHINETRFETNPIYNFLNCYETKSLTEEGSGKLTVETETFERLKKQDQVSFRSLCLVSKISSDQIDILLDEGDAFCGWTQETSEREETSLKDFKKKTIRLFEMYARPKVSQRLLDDSSIDIESWVQTQILDHFTKLETKSFLFGDGENQPKGILSYKDITTSTVKNINSDVFIETIMSLPSNYLAGACWLMSASLLSSIYKLKDSSGRFLWLNEKMSTTFLGYPVVIIDELANSQNIIFGNLKNSYQIIDHKNMVMMKDPYSSKPYVEFYTTKRVGGDVFNPDALRIIQIEKA